MMTRHFRLLALLCLQWLIGCSNEPASGNSDGSADVGGQGDFLGEPTLDPLVPSDASVPTRANVLFQTTCQGGVSGGEVFCHGLGAGGFYARLLPPGADIVGVPSTERPELARVKPGDLAQSYLYLKLVGDGGIDGGQMPLGGPYDPRIRELVGAWISAGAKTP
jgi:hypothetical protein